MDEDYCYYGESDDNNSDASDPHEGFNSENMREEDTVGRNIERAVESLYDWGNSV